MSSGIFTIRSVTGDLDRLTRELSLIAQQPRLGERRSVGDSVIYSAPAFPDIASAERGLPLDARVQVLIELDGDVQSLNAGVETRSLPYGTALLANDPTFIKQAVSPRPNGRSDGAIGRIDCVLPTALNLAHSSHADRPAQFAERDASSASSTGFATRRNELQGERYLSDHNLTSSSASISKTSSALAADLQETLARLNSVYADALGPTHGAVEALPPPQAEHSLPTPQFRSSQSAQAAAATSAEFAVRASVSAIHALARTAQDSIHSPFGRTRAGSRSSMRSSYALQAAEADRPAIDDLGSSSHVAAGVSRSVLAAPVASLPQEHIPRGRTTLGFRPTTGDSNSFSSSIGTSWPGYSGYVDGYHGADGAASSSSWAAHGHSLGSTGFEARDAGRASSMALPADSRVGVPPSTPGPSHVLRMSALGSPGMSVAYTASSNVAMAGPGAMGHGTVGLGQSASLGPNSVSMAQTRATAPGGMSIVSMPAAPMQSPGAPSVSAGLPRPTRRADAAAVPGQAMGAGSFNSSGRPGYSAPESSGPSLPALTGPVAHVPSPGPAPQPMIPRPGPGAQRHVGTEFVGSLRAAHAPPFTSTTAAQGRGRIRAMLSPRQLPPTPAPIAGVGAVCDCGRPLYDTDGADIGPSLGVPSLEELEQRVATTTGAAWAGQARPDEARDTTPGLPSSGGSDGALSGRGQLSSRTQSNASIEVGMPVPGGSTAQAHAVSWHPAVPDTEVQRQGLTVSSRQGVGLPGLGHHHADGEADDSLESSPFAPGTMAPPPSLAPVSSRRASRGGFGSGPRPVVVQAEERQGQAQAYFQPQPTREEAHAHAQAHENVEQPQQVPVQEEPVHAVHASLVEALMEIGQGIASNPEAGQAGDTRPVEVPRTKLDVSGVVFLAPPPGFFYSRPLDSPCEGSDGGQEERGGEDGKPGAVQDSAGIHTTTAATELLTEPAMIAGRLTVVPSSPPRPRQAGSPQTAPAQPAPQPLPPVAMEPAMMGGHLTVVPSSPPRHAVVVAGVRTVSTGYAHHSSLSPMSQGSAETVQLSSPTAVQSHGGNADDEQKQEKPQEVSAAPVQSVDPGRHGSDPFYSPASPGGVVAYGSVVPAVENTAAAVPGQATGMVADSTTQQPRPDSPPAPVVTQSSDFHAHVKAVSFATAAATASAPPGHGHSGSVWADVIAAEVANTLAGAGQGPWVGSTGPAGAEVERAHVEEPPQVPVQTPVRASTPQPVEPVPPAAVIVSMPASAPAPPPAAPPIPEVVPVPARAPSPVRPAVAEPKVEAAAVTIAPEPVSLGHDDERHVHSHHVPLPSLAAPGPHEFHVREYSTPSTGRSEVSESTTTTEASSNSEDTSRSDGPVAAHAVPVHVPAVHTMTVPSPPAVVPVTATELLPEAPPASSRRSSMTVPFNPVPQGQHTALSAAFDAVPQAEPEAVAAPAPVPAAAAVAAPETTVAPVPVHQASGQAGNTSTTVPTSLPEHSTATAAIAAAIPTSMSVASSDTQDDEDEEDSEQEEEEVEDDDEEEKEEEDVKPAPAAAAPAAPTAPASPPPAPAAAAPAAASPARAPGTPGAPTPQQWAVAKAFVLKLLLGHVFVKHGRAGWPHKRLVWLDATQNELGIRWGHPALGVQDGGIDGPFMSLGEIKTVAKGIGTPVMKRSGKASKSDLYWSMVSAGRTLDLECTSKAERDEWSDMFSALLQRPGLLQQAMVELYTTGQWRPPGGEEEVAEGGQ